MFSVTVKMCSINRCIKIWLFCLNGAGRNVKFKNVASVKYLGWNLIIVQHGNGYSSMYNVIQTVYISVRDIIRYIIGVGNFLYAIIRTINIVR